MRFKSLLLFLSLVSLDALAYCDQWDHCLKAVFSPRIGVDWAQVGESQSLFLLTTDEMPDYFENTQETSTQLLLGAFLGAQFSRGKSKKMLWEMGLAYYQPQPFESEGTIYFFSDPNYGDKTYEYSLNNQRLLFENKFLYGFTKRFYGYLLGGIGVNLNKAYDYRERSINPQTPADGKFDSHSETSFGYSLGIGGEYVINKGIRIGLGYQYTDLGSMSFEDYNNGNTDETLSLSNIQDQELVLALTFTF